MVFDLSPPIHKLRHANGYQLDILRLDLIHDQVSGNKWFKLKYNVSAAKDQGHHTILTFGGAYSNHIAATALTCKMNGLNAIGVIRGEDQDDLNPTLLFAKKNGMQIHFISRQDYLKKNQPDFLQELTTRFGKFYPVPEGGNNQNGILGCKEILKPELDYDYVLCACGTGATYAGLQLSLRPEQILVGINVLKGENTLVREIENQLSAIGGEKMNVKGNEVLNEPVITQSCILNTYAFSGYAKYDQVLIDFKSTFESEYAVALDHIYTNKLMFATFDLFDKKKFRKGSKILAIHSGGLQGNEGFEKRYHLKLNL